MIFHISFALGLETFSWADYYCDWQWPEFHFPFCLYWCCSKLDSNSHIILFPCQWFFHPFLIYSQLCLRFLFLSCPFFLKHSSKGHHIYMCEHCLQNTAAFNIIRLSNLCFSSQTICGILVSCIGNSYWLIPQSTLLPICINCFPYWAIPHLFVMNLFQLFMTYFGSLS